MTPVGPAEMAGRLKDGLQVYCARMDALDRFGDTAEDFRKSFWCLFLLYPFVFAALYRINIYSDGFPALTLFAAETSNYLIALSYWPLAMAYISILLGKPENWIRYVVALNWAMATPLALQIALLLTMDMGEGGGTGIWLIFMLIQGWSLFIGGMVLKRLFETSLPLTVLLVLSDLVLSRSFDWLKTQAILQSL